MMKKKRKMAANRAKASPKQSRVHSDKMGAYGYDKKPGVLMKDTPADRENRADMALKNLMRTKVFPSAAETIKQSNSNKRRYE